MEENKVAPDSSAPNSPELTRLSGEQAEERTASYIIRQSDEPDTLYWELVRASDGQVVFCDAMEPEDALLLRDLRPLVDELNQQATECSRLASHVQELKSDVRRWKDASDANRDEAMKQQDLKLGQKQIASRLASRVEGVDENLRTALLKLNGLLLDVQYAIDDSHAKTEGRWIPNDRFLPIVERTKDVREFLELLAGAHAEEKGQR